MVRTRRPKKVKEEPESDSASVDLSNDTNWKMWLMDFDREMNRRLCNLDEKLQAEIDGLDNTLQLFLAQIPTEELDRPLSQARESVALMESILDTSSLPTVKKGPRGLVTSTVQKPAPSTERQSRARTRLTRTASLTDIDLTLDVTSSRRMTRSSSLQRDNVPICGTLTKYQFQTPDRGNRPVPQFVTPKVDPYCPMPLKRYARQGEVAISLTGSPLMMTTNITEPNISLPVTDGQVYSIMATKGHCPTIPVDESTREKLRILRQNLNQLLGEED